MTDTPQAGSNSNEQLRSIVERIETAEAEIKDRQKDRSEIYTEAGSNGWDVKALRMIVRLRKQDADEREQFEGVVDTYKAALGME